MPYKNSSIRYFLINFVQGLILTFALARPRMLQFLKEGKKDLLQKMFDRIHDDIQKLGADGDAFLKLLYDLDDHSKAIKSMEVTNDWHYVSRHMNQMLEIAKGLSKKEAEFISLMAVNGPSFSLNAG